MTGFRPGLGFNDGLVRIGTPEPTDGHSPEHLREAVEVSARGDGDQVEIQLGHFCNNRCVFCVSGQLTEQRLARRIGTEPIFAALEAAASKGMRRVTFLGGEPTIQPSFLPTLKHALALGFDDIVIFTNGVRTWKERFMEEVVALGRFTWRFSIQGGDAETHDRVVMRQGAFARIIAGLEWLQSRDQDVTANMCVNELSWRSLPKFGALLTGLGVRQLHVDMVRPNGTGVRSDEHLRSILSRYCDMAGALDAMLTDFEARDPSYDVNVGNLPYCVLPTWAHRINHGGEQTTTVTTNTTGELARVWDKYRYQASDMVFAEACAPCSFRDRCRGVPDKYAEFWGLGELAPLPAEVRAEADRRRQLLHTRQGRTGRAAGEPPNPIAGALRRVRRLRAAAPFGAWDYLGARATADGEGIVVLFGDGDATFELVLQGTSAEFRCAEGVEVNDVRAGIEAVSAALQG